MNDHLVQVCYLKMSHVYVGYVNYTVLMYNSMKINKRQSAKTGPNRKHKNRVSMKVCTLFLIIKDL